MELQSLEQYLKEHPNFHLSRDDFKIHYYSEGIQEESMELYFVVNDAWPDGIWRVDSEGQLCQYHGDIFKNALKKFEKGSD